MIDPASFARGEANVDLTTLYAVLTPQLRSWFAKRARYDDDAIDELCARTWEAFVRKQGAIDQSARGYLWGIARNVWRMWSRERREHYEQLGQYMDWLDEPIEDHEHYATETLGSRVPDRGADPTYTYVSKVEATADGRDARGRLGAPVIVEASDEAAQHREDMRRLRSRVA